MKFQQIWSEYGKSVVFPAVVIIAVILYFMMNDSNDQASTTQLLTQVEQPQMIEVEQVVEEEEPMLPESVIVDVKGAVHYPGIVQLTTEDRVMDAIEAAGGYTENANPVTINHAQKLVDEMVIYVPQQGESMDELAIPSSTVTSVAGTSSSAKDDGKININTATEAELTTLSGIGPAKAAAIIAYREEHGSFKTVEDLKNVSGIGEKTFEKLQDSIKVK